MDQVAGAHLSPWVNWQPGQSLEATILALPRVSDAERHTGPRLSEFRVPKPQVAAKRHVVAPQGQVVRGATWAELPTELAKCAHEEPPNLGLGRRRRPACQRTAGSPGGRTRNLPAGGHQNSC